MTRKLTGGLACYGVLLACALSLARNQKEPGATTRLIESIQGPALYRAYCTVCHGPIGTGNGPMAKSLKVKPADLTRITARNGGKFPLVRVQKIITGEEPMPGAHGPRTMPVWGPIFSQIAWDQDLGRIRVYNLARFIEGLQAK
jgi:mono/diheme cytochrome c family protein